MTNIQTNKADILLQQVKRHQTGHMTIFLGAAPGVGKTFAMLSRAHELYGQGQNVAIGYIETHGRLETEELVAGLPVIPRKIVEYKNHNLEEMDLDSILQIHPDIVLVDELAHQNIPGSRHKKRWQDINELLDAGIDVFTTMNIQHLESLNDVIFQITGIRVKETVPDQIFERIRDIRLIDLPVNELLERLNQGKVYVPDQAAHALKSFFNIANLTALRELAIQTVAHHIDIDAREQFDVKGLSLTPLNNHVLIMIQGNQNSEALVRIGSRIAERRNAKWTVVAFLTTASGYNPISFETQSTGREIERALHLARQLGGMTDILYGKNYAGTLYNFAYERGISILVLEQESRPLFYSWLRPPLAHQLLKYQPAFELSIVPVQQGKPQAYRFNRQNYVLNLKELIFVLITTITSILIAKLSVQYLKVEELSLIFITAVIFVAANTRMTAAMLAAILFFFAYNFFFIPPTLTFQISAHKSVITVVAFLAAALIAGRLASRLREQVVALRSANSYNSIMQDLGQKLSVAVDLQQVIEIGQNSLEKSLNVQVWFKLSDETALSSDENLLTEKEKISANWTLKNHQPSGRFTQTLSESAWWFLPLLASKECIGVIGLNISENQREMNIEQRRLAEAMVEYITQAITRTQLSKELEYANISSETEKLRSALLSSVSHDLRSPLAAMIGAADTIATYKSTMTEEDQLTLLETIGLEGERLDRYIQNLLDMTRLGYQGLKLTRDWIEVHELVDTATRRLKRYKPVVEFNIQRLPQELKIYVHPALIEQALFNVLENAAKFNPEDQPIDIILSQPDTAHIQFDISDQGKGIDIADREKIFDMFYTMHGDRNPTGTGLGLAIVKAIISAHIGSIKAQIGLKNKGTNIQIVLPVHISQD
jgi:two-component system sensor histidine kinase KdpD